MDRAPGLSVRLKLTLSYAGFLMLAGALLLAAVWVFLLRYVPERALIVPGSTGTPGTDIHGVFPKLLHVLWVGVSGRGVVGRGRRVRAWRARSRRGASETRTRVG